MLFKLIKYFLFTTIISFSVNQAYSMDHPEKKPIFRFKIGFEFQEENNLCAWAYGNLQIQKKAIFTAISSAGKKLWHLEIDGKDIEFVTEPFANEDTPSLLLCIDSIQRACFIISELTKVKEEGPLLFKEWMDGFKVMPKAKKNLQTLISYIKKNLKEIPTSLTIASQNPEILIVIHGMICSFKEESKIHTMIDRLQQYCSPDIQSAFMKWSEFLKKESDAISKIKSVVDELEKKNPIIKQFKTQIQTQIQTQITNIEKTAPMLGLLDALLVNGVHIVQETTYEKVMNQQITGVGIDWKPTFIPHVTIQHSLKDSIPIVVSLFSSIKTEDIGKTLKIEQNIIYALPLQDHKETDFSAPQYLTEENGLLFLHALICAGIEKEENPIKAFDAIQANSERGQVDPKVNLYFLCRRPFSSMWTDVKNQKDKEHLVFSDLYEQRIMGGNSFFRTIIVPNFKFINYAEEYYDDETDKRKNLSYLKGKSLIDLSGSLCIDSLLSKGILSTSFIRCLFPYIFDDYLRMAIRTVDFCSNGYQRIPPLFDFVTNLPWEIASANDDLSPPWFLDLDNSMGAYTNEKLKEQNFDPLYGEAILEMRFIRFISLEALNAMKIKIRPGQFLTGKVRSLTDDVSGLISILNYEFIINKYNEEIKKITALKSG